MDLEMSDDGRYHCPYCTYDTQLVQKMTAHLRKKHQFIAVRPLVDEGDDTPQAETPDDI